MFRLFGVLIFVIFISRAEFASRIRRTSDLELPEWPTLEESVDGLMYLLHDLYQLAIKTEDTTKVLKANQTLVAFFDLLPDILAQAIELKPFQEAARARSCDEMTTVNVRKKKYKNDNIIINDYVLSGNGEGHSILQDAK
jgi:hypothetical protein